MSTLNKCLFRGNLTRNVTLTQTASGLPVCNFTLAVSSLRREPQGATLFISCTAWKKTAEFLADKVGKGDQVMVEGHLEPQSWTDAESGATRTKLVLHVHTLDLIRRASSRSADASPDGAPEQEEAPPAADGEPRSYKLNRRSKKAPTQDQAA